MVEIFEITGIVRVTAPSSPTAETAETVTEVPTQADTNTPTGVEQVVNIGKNQVQKIPSSIYLIYQQVQQ